MVISHRMKIVPALLAIIAAACRDSSGPDAACRGADTFNLTVSGAATETLTGCATYYVTGSSVAIYLTGGTRTDTTHMFNLYRIGPRPEPGAYGFSGPSAFLSSFILKRPGTPFRAFDSNGGGTINITTSAAGRVAGNFSSVTAQEYGAPMNTVTVSGTFSAKCVTVPDTVC